MKPNHFEFTIDDMKNHVLKDQELGDAVNWKEILDLEGREKVTSIRVLDNNGTKELACVVWKWNDKGEIKIGKIDVAEAVQRKKFGNTLMKMLIAIAHIQGASRITGIVSGKKFLWNWYQDLGFKIHDENKLIMEL